MSEKNNIVWEKYLQYFSEICAGARPMPAGLSAQSEDEMAKVVELQTQVLDMGIPEFVRRCAEAAGETIPQEALDAFDLQAVLADLEAEASQEAPVKTEVRNIYEVFLDSVCLEESLLAYLIDLLRREDHEGFKKLSQVAARTHLDMEDFRVWLGHKELLGDEAEQLCVRVMDGCLSRLMDEGKAEVAAALLSGDEKTFVAFRAEAPELQHLPVATYEWFCTYYLDRYYPVRFMIRANGVTL